MQPHIDLYYWCAFQIFVVVKLVSDVVLQGQARAKANIVTYAEDRKDSKRVAPVGTPALADDGVMRATNLFRNDLENLIPFCLVALAGAFVQVDARVFLLLLCIYGASRISHAICLISAKQPFRSLSYLVGQLCMLTLVVFMTVRLINIFQTY